MFKSESKKNEYNRQYRANNKEKIAKRQKAYNIVNKDKFQEPRRISNQIRYSYVRHKVINSLGGKCVCCGNNEFEFLAIDHIHGGGSREQKLYGGTFAERALREGIPKDKYQILCHNCNQVKRTKGQCTHSHFNIFSRSTWTVLL